MLVSTAGSSLVSKKFQYAEIEAKIARRDFDGICKEDLPTPSLLIDKQMLEHNLNYMAGYYKTTGISLRAHCKVHKSIDVATRQEEMAGVAGAVQR